MSYTADVARFPPYPYFGDIYEILGIPPYTFTNFIFSRSDGTALNNLTLSYTSSNTAVGTISGNTLTIVGVGDTTITCNQTHNSDPNYYSTPVTFVVYIRNTSQEMNELYRLNSRQSTIKRFWSPIDFEGYKIKVYHFDGSLIGFVGTPGVQLSSYSSVIYRRVGETIITIFY